MSKFVLTAELQLKAPTNVSNVVRQIQSQLNNVSVNVAVQNSAQANKQLNNISKSASQATDSMTRLGKTMTASVRKFTALAIATRAVSLFTSTLSGAIKEAISFEREMIKVSQVTGKAVSDLGKLNSTITNLATSMGVSSTSLLSVTRILAQAGLSARDTEIALSSLARTELAPTFDNITQTAEGAIAILNQFGQGAAALEGQLGSLNAVAGSFAVESGDLIATIRRTGGVFKAAGGDLNELIALFTSVRSTTRESAESIATGLRTIFTRIQRPKTIEYLKQFGVELTDIEGKFVGPYQAIGKLSQALAGLGERDITFVQIAEELGGFRQIGKVLPLLQQYTVAQEALKVAQRGAGSLAKDQATAQAALAIQITKVKEEFSALVRGFTETGSFRLMAETVLSLASAMIKLADTIKPVLPLLTAVAGVKLATGIGKAVGAFSAAKGLNQGGKVHHFATGGMVPGSGNRDTVPAMLTPGEFVIRKSSVQKLGAENLAQMNAGGSVQKFAAGGIVTSGRHAYGADALIDELISEPLDKSLVGDKRFSGLSPAQRKFVNTQRNLKIAATSGTQSAKPLNLRGRQRGMQQTPVQFSANKGQIGAFVLQPPKNTDDVYSQTGEQPFNIPPSSRTAKLVSQQLGVPVPLSGFAAKLSKSSFPILYAGGQDARKNKQINRSIDVGYKKGMLTALDTTINSIAQSKALDFDPAINTNESVMKSAASQILSDQQARSSVAGYLFESVITALTGASAAGGKESFDFTRASLSQNRGKLAGTFGSPNIVSQLVKAEAKRSRGQAVKDLGRKTINDIVAGRMSGVTLMGGPSRASRDKARQERRGFASGGAATGTDTVPAMLTPGEFVVSRKAAKNIGYGNLNRMNKVGKYAKGGIVQHFRKGSTGTGVSPAGGAGIANINQSIIGLGKNLSILSNQVQGAIASVQSLNQANGVSAGIVNNTNAALNNSANSIKDNAEANDAARTTSMSMGMSLAFAASSLQVFASDIDETSSTFDILKNGLIDTATQLGVAAGMLQSFGVNLSQEGIKSGLVSLSNMAKGAKDSTVAFIRQRIASLAGTTAQAANTTAVQANTGAVANNTTSRLDKLAGGISSTIIATTAVVSAFRILNGAIVQSAKMAKDNAIKSGDVQGAGVFAEAEASGNVRQNFGTAGGIIGGILGGIAGLFAGGGPLSAGVGAAAGAGAGTGVGMYLADLIGYTEEYGTAVRTSAMSLAQASKVNEAMAKATKNVTSSMKQFEAGAISITDVLSERSNVSAGQEILKQRDLVNQANQAATAQFESRRERFGEGGLFGINVAQEQQNLKTENEARSKELSNSISTYIEANRGAVNSLMRSSAATGSTFDEFFAQIRASNSALAEAFEFDDSAKKDLEQGFKNVAAEAEKARAAFAAINLGFTDVGGRVASASAKLNDYIAAQEFGNNAVRRASNILETALTTAANNISNEDFNKNLNQTAAALQQFGGATDDQIAKFKENSTAIFQAQKSISSLPDVVRDKLNKRLTEVGDTTGTGPGRQTVMAEAVEESLKDAGIGAAVAERIGKALTQDFSPEDVTDILAGGVNGIVKALKELGEDHFKQFGGSIDGIASQLDSLNNMLKDRISIESQLRDSMKQTVDVQLEAAQIIQEFGGATVTSSQKIAAAVNKANIDSGGLGISPLQTGSAGELAARQQEIKQAILAIQAQQAQATGAGGNQLSGSGGIQMQNELERLNGLLEQNYATTKAIIDAKKEEINIIKAKTAAEKKAMDALLGNDIEAFLDEMAGKGAMAAAATGSTALMGQFAPSAYGTAAKNLTAQRDAGVQSVMGIDINELLKRTYFGGGMASGLPQNVAMGMAQDASGTGPEIRALNAEIRKLASTLGGNFQVKSDTLQADLGAADLKITNAQIVITNAAGGGGGGPAPAAPVPVKTPSRGGMIYAQDGQYVEYKPKGTDTVPAMLTPGEFVVNAKSTKKYRSVLENINSGKDPQYASRGGIIGPKYLARGGDSDEEKPAKGGKGSVFDYLSGLKESDAEMSDAQIDMYNKLATKQNERGRRAKEVQRQREEQKKRAERFQKTGEIKRYRPDGSSYIDNPLENKIRKDNPGISDAQLASKVQEYQTKKIAQKDANKQRFFSSKPFGSPAYLSELYDWEKKNKTGSYVENNREFRRLTKSSNEELFPEEYKKKAEANPIASDARKAELRNNRREAELRKNRREYHTKLYGESPETTQAKVDYRRRLEGDKRFKDMQENGPQFVGQFETEYQVRRFESDDGRFSTNARLTGVSKDGQSAIIVKQDGSSVSVPFNRLSSADRDYVNSARRFQDERAIGKQIFNEDIAAASDFSAGVARSLFQAASVGVTEGSKEEVAKEKAREALGNAVSSAIASSVSFAGRFVKQAKEGAQAGAQAAGEYVNKKAVEFVTYAQKQKTEARNQAVAQEFNTFVKKRESGELVRFPISEYSEDEITALRQKYPDLTTTYLPTPTPLSSPSPVALPPSSFAPELTGGQPLSPALRNSGFFPDSSATRRRMEEEKWLNSLTGPMIGADTRTPEERAWGESLFERQDISTIFGTRKQTDFELNYDREQALAYAQIEAAGARPLDRSSAYGRFLEAQQVLGDIVSARVAGKSSQGRTSNLFARQTSLPKSPKSKPTGFPQGAGWQKSGKLIPKPKPKPPNAATAATNNVFEKGDILLEKPSDILKIDIRKLVSGTADAGDVKAGSLVQVGAFMGGKSPNEVAQAARRRQKAFEAYDENIRRTFPDMDADMPSAPRTAQPEVKPPPVPPKPSRRKIPFGDDVTGHPKLDAPVSQPKITSSTYDIEGIPQKTLAEINERSRNITRKGDKRKKWITEQLEIARKRNAQASQQASPAAGANKPANSLPQADKQLAMSGIDNMNEADLIREFNKIEKFINSQTVNGRVSTFNQGAINGVQTNILTFSRRQKLIKQKLKTLADAKGGFTAQQVAQQGGRFKPAPKPATQVVDNLANPKTGRATAEQVRLAGGTADEIAAARRYEQINQYRNVSGRSSASEFEQSGGRVNLLRQNLDPDTVFKAIENPPKTTQEMAQWLATNANIPLKQIKSVFDPKTGIGMNPDPVFFQNIIESALTDQGIKGRLNLLSKVYGRKLDTPKLKFQSQGGIVYASEGMMVPKGKDKIPAMLSKGEFVVNDKSAKKYRGALEAINKSKGGRVRYLAGGGDTSSTASLGGFGTESGSQPIVTVLESIASILNKILASNSAMAMEAVSSSPASRPAPNPFASAGSGGVSSAFESTVKSENMRLRQTEMASASYTANVSSDSINAIKEKAPTGSQIAAVNTNQSQFKSDIAVPNITDQYVKKQMSQNFNTGSDTQAAAQRTSLSMNSTQASKDVENSAWTKLESVMSSLNATLLKLNEGVTSLTRQSNTGGNNTPNAGGQTRVTVNGLDGTSMNGLSSALNAFNKGLSDNINQLKGMSIPITMGPVSINVNLSGGEFLKNITGEVTASVMQQVGQEISNYKVGPNGSLTNSRGSNFGN